MFECERSKACKIHRAPVESIRDIFYKILIATYTNAQIREIIAWTREIMLDPTSVKVLDEEPQDVVERAAQAGERWSTQAAAWVRLTFEETVDDTQ